MVGRRDFYRVKLPNALYLELEARDFVPPQLQRKPLRDIRLFNIQHKPVRMALNRKYAGLPGLDDAPDVYATPELTDDNSTARGRDRSQSTSSSYHDFEDEEDNGPGIHRGRLDPNEARSVFSLTQVDARDVDFSDRVSAKRKSYKVSTRRQLKDGTLVYGDISDDEEDEESLERRFARLRREIEEVKEAYERRNAKSKDGIDSLGPGGQDITQLSRILDEISTNPPAGSQSDGGKLPRDVGTSIKANKTPEISQGSGEAATYQQSHALAKAADFDGRLALLEKSLGLNIADLPTATGSNIPKAILPTLEKLQQQVALLSESTPSSLDSISRRVRALTQEADRLEDSRKNAKAAQDALRAGGDAIPEGTEDTEQIAKINALFGTLSTIDTLAPLLPSLLDRLRSLRAIHADAATASERMELVEKRQADMAEDIKKWTEGLEKVEEALEKGETVMSGNMKVVEGWVKELEEKMEKL